ncbi:hypothetical protein Trydic_g12697 [Trypoxylus dichotomus]
MPSANKDILINWILGKRIVAVGILHKAEAQGVTSDRTAQNWFKIIQKRPSRSSRETTLSKDQEVLCPRIKTTLTLSKWSLPHRG